MVKKKDINKFKKELEKLNVKDKIIQGLVTVAVMEGVTLIKKVSKRISQRIDKYEDY